MTSRVFDCNIEPRLLRDRARRDLPRRRGIVFAASAALLLVPLAGAAEQPTGWVSAAIAAILTLGAFSRYGGRGVFGWLLVLSGMFVLAAQRGVLPQLGPALFVSSALCGVLWLANRPRRGRWSGRIGEREREAQQQFGLDGEQQVRATLARELSEAYAVINGLALPRGAGDIDHVVIGPSGVFLLETKTMAGRIVCEPDGTWHRTKVGRGGTSYVAYIGDPAAQVQRNIYAVRESLRRRLPHLYSGTPLWLEGLVVFPHPRTDLAAERSRVPAIKLDHLVARIRDHRPQRILEPQDVIDITAVLLSERHARLLRASAQAMVELALTLPVVLALLFGTLALSRIVQAHSSIVAMAHEVARAGALGSNATDAFARMQLRASSVAPGLGLDSALLNVASDVSAYARQNGRVSATVRYIVELRDLPLLGWVPPAELRAHHVEWVDPFRGGIDDGREVGR